MSETPRKRTAKKAAAPKPKVEDVEVIVPPVGEVTVDVDGTPITCRVRRLRTREFLALINVVTAGLGPSLGQVQIDLADPESVQRDLSALMLLAIPNAVDEFTVFLRSIVEPVDPRHTGKVANHLLENPEIDTMIDVFEQVAIQEKDDLVVLAGKAQAMWSRVSQVYSKR